MSVETDKYVRINTRLEGDQTAPPSPDLNPFPGIWQDGVFAFSGTWENSETWGI